MLPKNERGICERMEESGKMERIELLEEIRRMLESATEKELDIVWRFLREVVKRG